MNKDLPKLAICGPGRCGKDTAARWLADNTPLRFGRSTSEVIAPFAAHRLGLPLQQAFVERHQHREFWFDLGNELRQLDPAFLARETLKDAEISVGIRSRNELAAVRRERLVDMVVWIDRSVPPDPTMEFGQELCDVVILNQGTLEELYSRLHALACWGRLAKHSPHSGEI